MSKGRVKPSLITLSRESLDNEDSQKFVDELLGSSDRACAIIGAAYVERGLLFLIQAKMRAFTKKESDALFFDDRAVLKTFSARCEIAYALEIVTKEEKLTLDAIRRIRNVFAHAIRPITFEHNLIVEACKNLPHNEYKKPEEELSPHRIKYVQCAATIVDHFTKVFANHPRKEVITKLVSDPYAQAT